MGHDRIVRTANFICQNLELHARRVASACQGLDRSAQ